MTEPDDEAAKARAGAAPDTGMHSLLMRASRV
jgi:hypothetical protein